MEELSLNILDIAQNSITAQATLVEIEVTVDDEDDLTIVITDNGKGMSADMLERVTDPFCTSRTTRNVGLGIPFFKQSAEITGGTFSISSTVGVGTVIKATYNTNSIDYTPMGAVWETVAILIQMNCEIDFIYRVEKLGEEFICDTRQLKEIMEDTPLSDLKVVEFIKDYIKENQQEILKRSY